MAPPTPETTTLWLGETEHRLGLADLRELRETLLLLLGRNVFACRDPLLAATEAAEVEIEPGGDVRIGPWRLPREGNGDALVAEPPGVPGRIRVRAPVAREGGGWTLHPPVVERVFGSG